MQSDSSIKHGLRVLTRARQRDAQRDDEAVARARRTGVHSMTVAHMSSTSELSSSSGAGAKLLHRTVQSLEDRCAMLVAENQAMSSLVGRMNRHLQLLSKQCLAICHASQNPVVDGSTAQEEQEEEDDVEQEAECGVDPETGARLDKVEEALRTLFLSFRPDSADPDSVFAETRGTVVADVDTVRPDANRRRVLEEAFMDGMQAVKEDIRALENALRHGHDGKTSPIDHSSAVARGPSDSQVREAMEELEGMRAQVAAALRVIRRQDSLLQFAVHRPTPSPQFRDGRGDSAAAVMVAARSTPSSHNERARTQPSTVVGESAPQTKRPRRQLAASEMPRQDEEEAAAASSVSELPVPASPATAAILESILGDSTGVDNAEEHERVGSTSAETRGHETPEKEDEDDDVAGTGEKEAESRDPAPVESARPPPGKGMPLRLKQRLDARRKHVGKAARSSSHTGRTTKRAMQGASNGL